MKKGSENKVVEKKVIEEKKSSKNETTKRNKHYIAEKKTVKSKREKKENIFKRIFKYFKGVGKEFKRIRWTDKKDLLKYSISTLVLVFFFGVYFYAIDWIVLLVRSLAK